MSDARESWNQVIRDRMHELETVASWASIVGYGQVRDICREAIDELRKKIVVSEQAAGVAARQG